MFYYILYAEFLTIIQINLRTQFSVRVRKKKKTVHRMCNLFSSTLSEHTKKIAQNSKKTRMKKIKLNFVDMCDPLVTISNVYRYKHTNEANKKKTEET